MTKECDECGNTFHKRTKEGKRDWSVRRFCGLPCYRLYQKKNPNKGTFKVGNHPPTEFKPGQKKPMNAYTFPKGSKHPNWKGKNVGYSGLHMWVRDKLGIRPSRCKNCEVEGKMTGRMWSIHWANKSGKYRRDVNDWIPLCRSCHKRYDDANRASAPSSR